MREQEAYDDNESIDLDQPLPPWTEEDRKIFGWTLAGTGVLTLGADVIAHWGIAGLLFGLPAAFLLSRHAPNMYAEVKEFLPWSEVQDVVEQTLQHRTPGSRSLIDRAMGRNYADQPQEGIPECEPQEQPQLLPPLGDEEALFAVQQAADTGGVKRLTIEQIVSHVEPNSYNIFIGRSLTRAGHPAVQINIYKQHFRFMGASQRGKSSMVAAFLAIVTRTHDRQHVQLALLDKEDQTSNLFAHLPHVARLQIGQGKIIRLHARTNEQVLEYLTYVVAIMNQRYAMSKQDILKQPILLVYIEEFLALKNFFKMRMDKAKGAEAKEQAKGDYATLVYCIEELAQRGLKARVQLLLCAQVEYADDDFKEALVNVGCGMSFCVRPTAAAAAGFRNTELIRRNAQENKIGQAVVETPDCNDLVLAPEYDLEQRLFELEQAQARYEATIRPQVMMSPEPPQQSPSEAAAEQELPTVQPRLRQKTDLERVLEVYNENPMLGYRDIGAKVGMGKDKVGELLKEAKERGLIA